MGTGKTQRVLQPLSQAQSQYICGIAPRQSLTFPLAKQLELVHYHEKDCEGDMHIAMCLPSVAAGRFRAFFSQSPMMFIDEVHSILSECHSVKSHLGKGAKFISEQLFSRIKKAPLTVVCDAYFDQHDADTLEKSTGKTVRIIEYREQAHYKVILTDKRRLAKVLYNSVKKGKKVFYSSSSANDAIKKACYIAKHYPDARVLCIHSHKDLGTIHDADVVAFLENPNEECDV
jgi:hypothetical protein